MRCFCSTSISLWFNPKIARRPMMKCKRFPDVESHSIHWVANIPLKEKKQLLELMIRRYPQYPKNKRQLWLYALYANVLIPVIENDGGIPQDNYFQDMLRAMNLNAWSISKHFDRLYSQLLKLKTA